MRFKPRYSKKIFPFAPGIPWTIKNERYVVPKIDEKTWNSALKDKNFVITCFGGFLESFFSFSYFESIYKIEPHRYISWCGYSDFKPLCKLYGTKFFDSENKIDYSIKERYPAPIFMDSGYNVYFNVLNNYIQIKSFNKQKAYLNNDICLKQLFDNSLMPWQNDIPKFINLKNKKYENWKQTYKFDDTKKFIVIFTKTWRTMHPLVCMDWDDRQIRELGEILSHLNISVIVCGGDVYDPFYKSSSVYRAPIDIEIILNLMKKSYGIISKDIDNLIIGMMMSNKTIIFSNIVKESFSKVFDFYKNAEYIGADNMIYTFDNIKPIDIFNICEGL